MHEIGRATHENARMTLKLPWRPSELHPGQKAERCPRCGAIGLIPWTLHRDPRKATAVRTWVCTACQATEERPEPD